MTDKRSNNPKLRAKPPDGGWGWVVAISSNFMLTIVLVNRTLGVFFNEWMDYFEASATAVGMVASIHTGTLLFMGPVGGFLCRKIGHRRFAIVSGVMIFISLLIASQAKTLIHLILAFGALGGTSVGFAFVNASTVISFYFRKRMATANSISNSGNAIAIMLQPIIARVLIDSYGWNGAIFVYAAIAANVCVCGMLFRPVRRVKKRQNSTLDHEKLSDSKDHDLNEATCEIRLGEEFVQSSSELSKLHSSVEHQRKLSTSSKSLDKDDDKQSLKTSNKENDSIAISTQSSKDDSESTKNFSTDSIKLNVMPNEDLKVIPNCSQTTEVVDESPNRKQRRQTKASLCLGHFARGSGLHLLKTKYRFNLFCFTQIIQAMCIPSVYMYIVPIAVAKDVPKLDAALLLSVVGVGSFVGRLVTGPFIDRKLIGILKLNFFICLTSGITMAVCPAVQSYASFVVIALVFGLASGMYKSIQLLLIKMFIGASEHLSAAWGIYMPYLGVGYLTAPIFVGWLRDKRGTFDLPFYITGSLFALSAFYVFLLPCLNRLEKKHYPENEAADLVQAGTAVPTGPVTSSVASMRNSMDSLTTI